MGYVVRPHPFRIERERFGRPLRLNGERKDFYGLSPSVLPSDCLA